MARIGEVGLASSTRATALAGVAEADETYQLRSYKGQPRRLYGVATSYLENYLGWFRALDRHAQIGSSSPALLALSLGI